MPVLFLEVLIISLVILEFNVVLAFPCSWIVLLDDDSLVVSLLNVGLYEVGEASRLCGQRRYLERLETILHELFAGRILITTEDHGLDFVFCRIV